MAYLTRPYLFDEFFASGRDESISPFLTPGSRAWGKNLPLKTAILSALCLSLAFATSFFAPQVTPLFLLFVYFLSGTPALLGAMHDICTFNINIDVLMTLAALLSIVIGSGMEGALLLVLFELSAAMETMVSYRTKKILSQLHHLTPRMACVITEDGSLVSRSVKDIQINTHLLIKAGEVVPLDGNVIDGSSSVNLVHLTGESHPIAKHVGDVVPAGARNLDGTLTIQVTRTSADSTLTKIIQLITKAQNAKPRLQQFLDRFGQAYATTIISLSTLFALTLPKFFDIPYFGSEGSIYRALAFLIAASPCALIIATPTAYLSAISACARRGILLKGGVVLDALMGCKAVAFDKTGTLTTGRLQLDPTGLDLAALRIAHTLERNAVHPIADAINEAALQHNLSPLPLTNFKSLPGFGLEGIIDSIPVAIGHADFIASKLNRPLPFTKKDGYLNALLLVGNDLFSFHFIDSIRPQSAPLIKTLHLKHHLRSIMLTGDHPDVAKTIAGAIGINEVYASLRPEDKLEKVAFLAEQEGGLIMVGDGINDAPALARATVGISMGKIGSATAIDASDIVFLNDDLSLLGGLLSHAHRTRRIIKQNLTLAMAVILCATTPTLLGLIPLWLAVILHEGGTVLVGLNSLRLIRY